MFSDTCDGENRNQNVVAMVMCAVQAIDDIHIIQRKFLEKGQNYMECDVMHYAIEFVHKKSLLFCISE